MDWSGEQYINLFKSCVKEYGFFKDKFYTLITDKSINLESYKTAFEFISEREIKGNLIAFFQTNKKKLGKSVVCGVHYSKGNDNRKTAEYFIICWKDKEKTDPVDYIWDASNVIRDLYFKGGTETGIRTYK